VYELEYCGCCCVTVYWGLVEYAWGVEYCGVYCGCWGREYDWGGWEPTS